MKIKKAAGILGYGEIGKAVAKINKEAGYIIYIRELEYDEIKGKKIDFLHVNIPEKNNKEFINLVAVNIKELNPKLTIINSSVSPGTTKKIYKLTNSLIVHSPVIGVHPHLYESIKNIFPKIIGPTSKKSLEKAKKHFKILGLKTEIYKSSDESESAKLLDLVYYAWNIIFCKWVKEFCDKKDLNFDDIYTRHNKIYNEGYKSLRPNVTRPILKPIPGVIGGHCTMPDTIIFDKYYKNRFTKFILKEDEKYKKDKLA